MPAVLPIEGKQAEHAVAYARTKFTAPAAMLAKHSIGFNDSLAVQLNGGEVFRDGMVNMPGRLDQNLVDAGLQEGRNSLLFKVGQATRGWFAMARLLPSSAERPQGYLLTEMLGECRAEALHTLTLSWLIKQGNARDAANRLFNRVNWMLIDKRFPLKRS